MTEARRLPFQAVNFSEGGLLVRMDQEVKAGALVDLQLKLPGRSDMVTCTGRIVRVEPGDHGDYVAAISIESIPPEDRRLLRMSLINS